ncbi:MAG TPA: MBL fold metallo-hydrolase, partial [Gammaproteobacteria bacterium]|nr:MBL fold metallo-hydrolase [Gammaproteobacteria bacterium]
MLSHISMKKSLFLFTLVFLLGCSDSKDDLSREIDTVILDDLIQHSNEFDKHVYSFDNGLHLAVGYG